MRCPHGDAEVRSEDVFCSECGVRLPVVSRESRRRPWPLILCILVVLVVACVAGGAILTLLADGTDTALSGPSPTPPHRPVPSASAALSQPSPEAVAPVPIEGADPYEPDDGIADSALITTDGVLQTHNLHREGDRDYLCFQANAGDAYTIETLDLGSEIDTIIYLLDENEQEIARNDDGKEEPLASLIIWIAPSSGTYYVMVRDLSEHSSGPDARYSISVTESAFAEGADPYESDDTLSEASLIDTDGTPQDHTIHTTTDVDYVRFVAEGGLEYAIETGNLLGDCDTVIYLYDGDGTELAYDDDAAKEEYASLIVWEAPSDGFYYVAIGDYARRAGPALSYQIRVSVQ
jgi:hypothetical protein